MISIEYLNPKNIRKKSVYQPPAAITSTFRGRNDEFIAERARLCKISVEEWLRRDNIVATLARTCPYVVGDTFYPAFEDWYKSHGKCIIEGKVISYLEIDKTDEWPIDDTPFIISGRSFEKNTKFVCRTDFLSKNLPEFAKNA